MAEVLRLTQAGRLMEATALLQGNGEPGSEIKAVPSNSDGGLIDLVADGDVWRAKKALIARTSDDTGDAQGRFDERSYDGPEGTIEYLLYRPKGAEADMPLVVMLHGCNQSPEDFARGTRMNDLADEIGFFVAYPRQSSSANPQKCWNWFKPGDQQRDHGEPALLAGITRTTVMDNGLDPTRVYVAGLSAGGAAAAIMAAEYPDIFAAVGIHSGLACGIAQNLAGALKAMKSGGIARDAQRLVPVITFHGNRDTTVHEVNSQQIIAAASRSAGVKLEVRLERSCGASGRQYMRSTSADASGVELIEQWTIEDLGHAWSGGSATGSFTDPSGPNASREMMRFFLKHYLDQD
ncbi:PHB depolymerase family esterase [Croceibacterium sp. TMG7-5b_MA50]|uniref:extracellular catalytic domain type 1 short-chain-length polyhydroxyalkanoate depolymerase n=1 Tax=Croceibacterium sp. TMG7-5b_MA50 TaxID=3121290 RepID=UPI003221BD82